MSRYVLALSTRSVHRKNGRTRFLVTKIANVNISTEHAHPYLAMPMVILFHSN
jgi:hypothetical protein